MPRLITRLLLCSLLVWITASCGTPRRGRPLLVDNQPSPDARIRAGERIFDTYCHSCHPGGTSGIGPALNNKPLPEVLIRTQVRTGVGAMPDFDEHEISDEELELLVAYIHWISDKEVEPQPDTEDGVPEFP